MVQKQYKRTFFGLLGFGILMILSAVILKTVFTSRNDPGKVTRNFNRILKEKEKKADKDLLLISKGISRLPFNEETFKKTGLAYFVFQGDSLTNWTSNAIPGLTDFLRPMPKPGLIRLSNGWYELRILKLSSRTLAGLILLQHLYPIENDYLANDFPGWFHVPDGTFIARAGTTHSITNLEGRFLFNLVFPSASKMSGARETALFLIYLAAFLLLACALYYLYLWLEPVFPNKWIFVAGFLVDLALLRLIQFYFRLPGAVYDSELFGPGIFSSSILLPSLGDFLINALLCLIGAYAIFRHMPSGFAMRLKSVTARVSVAAASMLLILASLYAVIRLVRQLVMNSNIPLDLADISSFTGYSLAGISIISILFLAYFLLAFRLSAIFVNASGLRSLTITGKLRQARFSITAVILYLFIFSLIATLFLNRFNRITEHSRRQLMALKLGTERDPMAEMMFGNIESLFMHDTLLARTHAKNPVISRREGDSIAQYIQNRYFGEFWKNYLVQVTVCQPDKKLQVQPQNILVDCRDYFSDIIEDYGKPTLSRHLYYLDYGFGYRNYLASIPIPVTDTSRIPAASAYIEISSRLVFKDLGYPELLMDKKQIKSPDMTGYSYAFYRNGKLIHRLGSFHYRLDLRLPEGIQPLTQQFFTRDGMNHFYYPIDRNNILLLSRNSGSLLDRIAPFSYLFFIFAFVTLLFAIIVRPSRIFNLASLQLGQRLQIVMTALILSSLLILGFLTVYYIIRLNTSKNLENLEERTHSILVELQHKMATADVIADDPPGMLNEQLTKFSNVFFVDVNLYSPDGRLIATSRPQVFEEGLISDLIDSRALLQLQTGRRSFFTQEENIGRYGYYSSYMPFYNDRNQLLAYLNLPYFARQEDLRREISTFLIAFINIYVFLIILGILTALIISTYISRPLRMLASGIGRLTLGGVNERLSWRRRDEIGKLVDEYNHMTEELIRSAELLARSERELAWREMARQVAHEIKNPLTPMLLSVQHLEKAWKENAPDREERLQRFCVTMTEQIENLAAIASEFSDFAKMPQTQNEQIDMKEQIGNVMEMYRDYAYIRFESRPDDETFPIIADRKQILRVFTNLINNSIQAIGNAPGGKILITLEKEIPWIVIKISDNGPGISAEQRGRMFQPNFTTKSGGMGLGLAIVKSIINGAGGEIGFFTESGKGTTFTIQLPQKEE